MTVEEKLSRALNDGLARVDVPPGDLQAVRAQGLRLRRNRRVLASALALTLVVGGSALFAGVVRGGDDRGVEPVGTGGTWQSIEPAPVAPRWDALSGWTGTEALFIGGGTSTPCSPGAECVDPDHFAKDGAAYNPTTHQWRVIAPAPVPMPYYFRSAMVGDTFVVFGEGHWYAYDAGDDAWRTLPQPPSTVRDPGFLSAADGKVYALDKAGAVQVLDVEQDTWSSLPASDLRPRLTQRTVVAAGDRVVVSGYDETKPNDGHEPSIVLADVWDGQGWTRLPATGQLSNLWHWTGERLVDLDLQTADGGQVEGWERSYPYGGRLDPTTGVWTALPGAPDPERDRVDGWHVLAADGPLLAGSGYVYDDSTGQWVMLGSPETTVDVDQSAVWADGRLIVFGGVDEETGYRDVSGLSNHAWVWTR
jgi:hypothetical protein